MRLHRVRRSILGSSIFAISVTLLTNSSTVALDWPQWLGPNRDGVWRETGLVDKFPKGGPKVVWKKPIGTGYGGPAVANGKVYVMERERPVDKDGKPVRSTRAGLPGKERILCLSADKGELLWKHEYDCPYKVSYPNGPRATPLVHKDRVYTLGTMGDLICLDAAKGDVKWSTNLLKAFKLDDPPVWGWAAHPLIDGDLLYCLVGGKGSAVVAFNKDTGKEEWRALSTDEIGYSPPVIQEVAGKRQLLIWLSESINSLNLANGETYWTVPYPAKGKPTRPSVNISTIRCDKNLLFVSSFYHGPMMLKLDTDKPGASVLWMGKSNNPEKPDGLHGVMATPILKDGHLYGINHVGALACYEAETGKELWKSLDPLKGEEGDCATVFLIEQGDRYVLYNDQGDLILAELSPKGYKEIDRANILKPTHDARGRTVVWSHPAFAQKCVFARNDKEIVCVSMAKD
jgi:outer membrane protein assembly factor BamB